MADDNTESDAPDGPREARALANIELIVISISDEDGLEELTRAEQEVVRLTLEGCTNKQIAERRGASVKTIANQLRGIYRKLGVRSRFELAARLGR